MQGSRRTAPRAAGALATAAIVLVAGAATSAFARRPAPNYHDEVSVQARSPWPEMRRDRRNTGASPVRSTDRGDRPWGYQPGRGTVSTPIVGGNGDVYDDSAACWCYA